MGDESSFIFAAYSLSGALIAALVIATWRRARRIGAQLKKNPPHES